MDKNANTCTRISFVDTLPEIPKIIICQLQHANFPFQQYRQTEFESRRVDSSEELLFILIEYYIASEFCITMIVNDCDLISHWSEHYGSQWLHIQSLEENRNEKKYNQRGQTYT